MSVMPATETFESSKTICSENLPLLNDLSTTIMRSQLPVLPGRAGEMVSWGGVVGLAGCDGGGGAADLGHGQHMNCSDTAVCHTGNCPVSGTSAWGV